MADRILEFYRGEASDNCGRMIEQIWNWDDLQLEEVHNYVQWLFPLRQRSGFNWWAPVLKIGTEEAFRESQFLKERLLRSLSVMLKFYGLITIEVPIVRIDRAEDFATKSANWLTVGNHNHLRLTRILKCTSILGLEIYSRALFTCLHSIYETNPKVISAKTHRFWEDALTNH